MPGLDHAPAEPSGDDSPVAARRNARRGLVLFLIYLAFYGAFVLLNAFRPDVMERTAAGVNFAILTGLGLIAAAFVLALFYAWLCRARGELAEPPDRGDGNALEELDGAAGDGTA